MGGASRSGTLSGRRITAVLTVLFSSAIPAHAEGLDQVRDFNIEEQALDMALIEFSEQAGVQLMVPTELVAGLRSPSIAGQYATDNALVALLDGSELTFQAIGDDTVALQATEQGGASDSKNLTPQPVLMAQNQTSPTTTNRSLSDEAGTSIVIGKVTDARTGANLKGAKVTIEETGQWTSTNNLGGFRFASVPMGSATLTVSYLGYAEQSAKIGVRGDAVSRSFALRGGNEIEEIVVFGQRSARALALNQERTAENSSTVLAADLLGNFSGTTISESLRRAPGIAFQPDPLTGDGANVIVRGLAPDLNQIRLNGVRLPDTSGIGRSANLSTLLTDSIDSVTVSKTLLPGQDSSGTGGLIDIETKSPLDRKRRTGVFGLEYTSVGNDFGEDFLASGLVSGRFGKDESFGASLSVQYRKRETNQINYSWSGQYLGQYLPAGITSISELDPRTERFPFEPGVDEAYPFSVGVSETLIEDNNISLTLSFEKQLADHTNLRLDITRATVESDSNSTTSSIQPFTSLSSQPIDELGGEERFALISEDIFPFFPGIILTPRVNFSADIGNKNETTTVSFRGATDWKRWAFEYGAGYADGKSNQPFTIFGAARGTGAGVQGIQGLFVQPEFLTQDVRGNTVNGLLVSIFPATLPGAGNSITLPGFTQAGFDFYNDPTGYNLAATNIDSAIGSTERFSGNGSARRLFNSSFLDYVEVGFNYDQARFEQSFGNGLRYQQTAGSIADLGISFQPGSLGRVGESATGFPGLPLGDMIALSQQVREMGPGSTPFLSIQEVLAVPLDSESYTEEREFAPYIQSKIDIGKLELIGGARLSILDLESAFVSAPSFSDANGVPDPTYRQRFGQIVTVETSRSDVLPRILANYRPTDTTVVRAGYYTTVARPLVRQLSTNQTVFLQLQPVLGPNGDQPQLLVSQGNPDLEPAFTHSFDLSAEKYFDGLGAIKASVFYKRINNPIEFNTNRGGQNLLPEDLDLPDTPELNNLPSNLFVTVSRPVNNENPAESWGFEISAERQFTFLPGFWGGFGAFANYTYTDSSSTRFLPFAGAPNGQVEVDVPLTGQAPHSGTVALTYNDHGVDANLIYSIQDRRRASFQPYGLSRFDEAIDTLDFRLEYSPEFSGTRMRFFVEGNDLLKGTNDPFLDSSLGGEEGTPRYYSGGTWLGGRNFTFGVSATF